MPDSLREWLASEMLGTPVAAYVALAATFVAVYAVYRFVVGRLESTWFQPLAKKQPALHASIIRLVKNPLRLLTLAVTLGIGLNYFDLPDQVARVASRVVLTLLAATIAYLLVRLVDVVVAFLQPRVTLSESRLDDQLLPAMSGSVKAFIVLIGAILILQNAGYNTSGLVAGLGLGGLAVALALQPTLANVFAAITIFVDQPFHVGDTVNIGGVEGSIEGIGLRSTRIRTWDGTLVTIPNSAVVSGHVDNIDARPTRRTTFEIGVTYETSSDGLETALSILREVMSQHPGTDSSRAHFTRYGDSALIIDVAHWCKYLDYGEYLACLEEINLEIKRRFEAAEIDMAYPTHTVHLAGETQGT